MVVVAHCEKENVKVQIDEQDLEQMQTFKCLGATITSNAKSDKEINIPIGQATCALAKLNNIWRQKCVKIKNKLNLRRAIVTATLLYGCESWTLIKESERKLRAFEIKCYGRLLGISWKERKTNESVLKKVKDCLDIENLEMMIDIIKSRKLKLFGHQMRRDGCGGLIIRSVIEGIVEGKRSRGRPNREWNDNLKECSGRQMSDLTKLAADRILWRRLVHDWPNRLSICMMMIQKIILLLCVNLRYISAVTYRKYTCMQPTLTAKQKK